MASLRDTFIFKLITSLLFGAAIYHRVFPKVFASFLALIGISCTLFPGLAIEILAVGSGVVLLCMTGPFAMGDFLVGEPDLFHWWNTFPGADAPETDVGVTTARLLGLFVAFGAAWTILSARGGWIRRNPVAAVLLVTAALGTIVTLWRPGPGLAVLAAHASLLAWSRILIPILFMRRTGFVGSGFKRSSLWLLLPLWNREVMPQWEVKRFPSARERASNASRLRPKLALLCAAYFLAVYLNRQLTNFFRVDWLLLDFQVDGIVPFIYTSPSVLAAWLRVWWSTVEVIVFYFGFGTSLLVGIQWMAGIPSPSNFQYPHRSKSFHEFFGRTMFYYARTVQIIGLFPLSGYLRVLRKYPRFRLFCITFAGTFTVSFVFHLIKRIQVMYASGSVSEMFVLWARMHGIYTLLLSLAVATSTAFCRRLSRELPPSLHTVRLLIIFWVYSVVSTLTGNFGAEVWQAKVALFRYLFSGSW